MIRTRVSPTHVYYASRSIDRQNMGNRNVDVITIYSCSILPIHERILSLTEFGSKNVVWVIMQYSGGSSDDPELGICCQGHDPV